MQWVLPWTALRCSLLSKHMTIQTATLKPCVARSLTDANYGREEFVEDCVNRILRGENIYLLAIGGYFACKDLPPILEEKYRLLNNGSEMVFIPGFIGIMEQVLNILAYPKKGARVRFAIPIKVNS
jgi:hypothetical protein